MPLIDRQACAQEVEMDANSTLSESLIHQCLMMYVYGLALFLAARFVVRQLPAPMRQIFNRWFESGFGAKIASMLKWAGVLALIVFFAIVIFTAEQTEEQRRLWWLHS